MSKPRRGGPATRDGELDLRGIFSPSSRRRRYLEVEAGLARAQAELDIIPPAAADSIVKAARLGLLDQDRMAAEHARTGHSLVPLISELSRAVGSPEGGWVPWGATTQNIVQTGVMLGLRVAHRILRTLRCDVLQALADLGERTADLSCQAARIGTPYPSRSASKSRHGLR